MREARGWSVDQVASQLNLAPRQVQAIERDDYASLPGMAVARGFIRGYAKLLKVDPVPLLAAIPADAAGQTSQAVSPRKTLSAPFAETRLPSMMERPAFPHKGKIIFLVIALAAAGVAFKFFQDRELPALTEALSTQFEKQAAAVSGKASESNAASTPDAATGPDAPSTAPPVNSVTGVEPSPPSTPPDQAAIANGQQASSAPGAPTESSSAALNALVLTSREDSWVEIRRADNSVLLSKVLKSGQSETVELTGPVSVTIGNAQGIDMTLRGAPVQVKSGSTNNVARLKLK
ncbi:RodZ domain-containing protein [Noviherbaspirillum sp.]|uniref:RodZ domain-containing protein n=1 Tax=Noviherbaspirillum sp. TaxID=1926288 RepID=UPI002FE0F11A